MTMTQVVTDLQIERRNKPSYAEFAEEFLFPKKPVVITGALDQWKAIPKWSPEYFQTKFGSLPLQGGGGNYTLGGFLPTRPDGSVYTMGEFIDMVLASTAEKPAPYLRNVWIKTFLPELNDDLDPVPSYFSPNWLEGPLSRPLHSRLHDGSYELYIGGAGGKFPLVHFDTWHVQTFLSQVYGVKEVTLFPPDQGPYLYAQGNQSFVGDIENVDRKKFPLYEKATPMRAQLQPGEIVFLPSGWWHTTKMLTPSITISSGRVNSSNWESFSNDLKARAPKPLKPLVSAYLMSLRLSHALAKS